MKNILSLALILISIQLFAQPNTEVHLVDIATVDGQLQLSNPRNISNNQEYDNQPSFYDDNTIIYAATRNGQTDIAKYNIETGETSWLTDTPVGSEYSPLRIPGSQDISAIRLDTTGYQRLYRYDIGTGESGLLLKDAKVGYHVWYDEDILAASVLVDEGMDLVVYNLRDDSNRTIQKSVGRSLHKIPNTELVSFIKFEDDPFSIKSLNPVTGSTERIITIPTIFSDICWLSDGTILAGDGNSLSKFNPKTDQKWEVIWSFNEPEIYQISRMAVSPDGKHMAIVSEGSPAIVVQKQVESFNAEDLDAFAACYSENVVVRNFPSDTLSTGNKTLKASYKRYFESNPKTTVEVVKRIQIGNVVIDEEVVERSGKNNRQAAIYEINGGKIASMTFIHEKEAVSEAAAIIDENLKAYRARDIEAFLDSYSENVEVYMFPGKLRYIGTEKMRLQYADFFKGAEGLTCEIKNRMVIGNVIIDEEYLTINGNHHSAVAIYEVENGKISKVTFIQ